MNWSNRVALVTGAGSGIGAALSEELADHGASVAMMDIDEEGLEDVENSLSGGASDHLTINGDVTEPSDVEDAFRKTRESLGVPDTVVANAGLGYTTPATELDREAFLKLTDVNYMGVVHTVSEALDDMLQQGSGQIAITSSVAAFTHFKGGAAYCASKSAVLKLADSFRLDLTDEAISVTTIHPGFVTTPMTEKYSEQLRMSEVAPSTAAETIRKGLENRKRQIIFPLSFKILVNVMSIIPDFILDYIRGKLPSPDQFENLENG